MTSGIYAFTFSSGHFYIGKSADIEKRWKQHTDNMLKGKHTKNIQDIFSGILPEFKVLYYCHEHHIDILESFFINANWGDPKLLNGTRPKELEAAEIEMIGSIPSEAWQVSTFEHFRQWSTITELLETAKKNLAALEHDIDIAEEEHEFMLKSIKDGTYLETVERALECFRNEYSRSSEELKRLKSRNWFQRLFKVGE
jgi:excinuclease UvrABC nuclease subunit